MKVKEYDRIIVLNDPVNLIDPWGLEAGFPDDFFGWGNPTAFGIPQSWEPELEVEWNALSDEIAEVGMCVSLIA